MKQKAKLGKDRIMQQPQQFPNYPNIYFPQMQMNGCQQIGFIDQYQNGYYYPFQIPPGMTGMTGMMGVNPMAYYPQYIMEQQKDLKTYLDNIYERGVVNNIIGAFYIKECQERQKNIEQKTVPVSMVELNEEQGNGQSKEEEKKEAKSEENKNDVGQMKMPHFVGEINKEDVVKENKGENIKEKNQDGDVDKEKKDNEGKNDNEIKNNESKES